MFVPTPANNFLNAYANNETVTQGIADYCEANGHGNWTKDGQDTHQCPRCGHFKTTKDTKVAEVSQTTLACSCGERHALMGGQAMTQCKCGANYKIPALSYNETAKIKSLSELEVRLHNQAIWKSLGKITSLTKLNDAHIREMTK